MFLPEEFRLWQISMREGREKEQKAASCSIDFFLLLLVEVQLPTHIVTALKIPINVSWRKRLSRPRERKGGWLKRSLFIVVEKFRRFQSRSLSRAPKPWREFDKGLSQRLAGRRTKSNWPYQSSKSAEIKEVWSSGEMWRGCQRRLVAHGWCLPWQHVSSPCRRLCSGPA